MAGMQKYWVGAATRRIGWTGLGFEITGVHSHRKPVRKQQVTNYLGKKVDAPTFIEILEPEFKTWKIHEPSPDRVVVSDEFTVQLDTVIYFGDVNDPFGPPIGVTVKLWESGTEHSQSIALQLAPTKDPGDEDWNIGQQIWRGWTRGIYVVETPDGQTARIPTEAGQDHAIGFRFELGLHARDVGEPVTFYVGLEVQGGAANSTKYTDTESVVIEQWWSRKVAVEKPYALSAEAPEVVSHGDTATCRARLTNRTTNADLRWARTDIAGTPVAHGGTVRPATRGGPTAEVGTLDRSHDGDQHEMRIQGAIPFDPVTVQGIEVPLPRCTSFSTIVETTENGVTKTVTDSGWTAASAAPEGQNVWRELSPPTTKAETACVGVVAPPVEPPKWYREPWMIIGAVVAVLAVVTALVLLGGGGGDDAVEDAVATPPAVGQTADEASDPEPEPEPPADPVDGADAGADPTEVAEPEEPVAEATPVASSEPARAALAGGCAVVLHRPPVDHPASLSEILLVLLLVVTAGADDTDGAVVEVEVDGADATATGPLTDGVARVPVPISSFGTYPVASASVTTADGTSIPVEGSLATVEVTAAEGPVDGCVPADELDPAERRQQLAETEAALADLPTEAPAPAPAPADPAGDGAAAADRIAEFVTAFDAAHASGDAGALFDSLDPASRERYGDDQCRSYLDGVVGSISDLRLVTAEPEPWDYETDQRSTPVADAWTVLVELSVQGGDPTEVEFHLRDGGDGVTWFTDCGEPV